ncbi:hypothetical protein EBB07_30655 [Paenibacillaceae bacterium]|nr:hypothetical protein EBB07_30655 [Paenibacillaceae bacterium]
MNTQALIRNHSKEEQKNKVETIFMVFSTGVAAYVIRISDELLGNIFFATSIILMSYYLTFLYFKTAKRVYMEKKQLFRHCLIYYQKKFFRQLKCRLQLVELSLFRVQYIFFQKQ